MIVIVIVIFTIVLMILAVVFASAVSSNFTGNNITLSCIREFYSDKGYGEDMIEFCKK